MVYSNTTVYGEKLVCDFWSLAYFHFLKHLIMLLKSNYFYFYTLSQTLKEDMQLRFFKVETLLDNVYKTLEHNGFCWKQPNTHDTTQILNKSSCSRNTNMKNAYGAMINCDLFFTTGSE